MKMRPNKQNILPLVSVIVITYNSSAFVLDTLESISKQTYRGPIELIISDDCSTDDTMKLCRDWTVENSPTFVKTEITQTPHNSGICANYNHALKHVTGEWVKYIAGDDILMSQCIQRFIEYSASSDDCMMISGVWCFHDAEGARFLMRDLLDTSDPYLQARNLANAPAGIVEGPTFFIKTSILKAMDGWDMTYPMLEDFPFAFRYTFAGHYRSDKRAFGQIPHTLRKRLSIKLYLQDNVLPCLIHGTGANRPARKPLCVCVAQLSHGSHQHRHRER